MTAVARRIGIPRSIVTVLEGESLFNSATALVAYRMAIAATLTESLSDSGPQPQRAQQVCASRDVASLSSITL